MGELRIGKYRIVDRLGEGGAGIVHRAVQEPLDREVAIKFLLRRHAESQRHLDAFLKEARIATTLQHENIVRGLDYGEADGYHYFAMELVEGESLYEIIRREGHLPERRAFEIARQVASALEYAGGYDLIHRDIKPENVLITGDGTAKLCDLGLARLSFRPSGAAGRDDEKIGTAAYMSPEQIRGETDLTFHTDMYSLGASLYQMVTGRPPFTGKTPQDMARQHLRAPVPDPRELNLEVSSGAASVIVKLLAKDPADRYSSYADLIGDIDAVLAGRPPLKSLKVGAKIGGLDPAARRLRRTREGGKRRLLVPVIILALVLAVGAAAVFLVPRGEKPPEPSDVTDTAGEPAGGSTSTPEDLDAMAEFTAREGLLAVKEALRKSPDIGLDELLRRYRRVADDYPETRAGEEAAEEVRKLEREVTSRENQKAEAVRAALDSCVKEANSLVGQACYGAAVERLETFGSAHPENSVAEVVTRETSRIRREALAHAERLLEDAAKLREKGDFASASEALRDAPEFGIPELDGRIRAASEEVDRLAEERAEARAEHEETFQLVSCAALWRAARSEFDAAVKELAAAAKREDLAFFRADLERLSGQIEEVRHFASGLRAGGATESGKRITLELIGPSPATREFGVGDSSELGIEVSGSRSDEVIPWDEISSDDLLRIAFLSPLSPESAADRRAAVLYMIAHGRFRAADASLEELRITGGRMGGIGETRKSFEAYVAKRADLAIDRAETLRAGDRSDEALEVLADLVRCAPESPGARVSLAATLISTGEAESALAQLRIARDLGSEDPALFFHTGEALLALGRKEEGLESLKEYLGAAPKGAHAARAGEQVAEIEKDVIEKKVRELERSGRSAFRRKNWAEVIEDYGEIERLVPGRTDAAYYKGVAQLRAGETVAGYLTLRAYVEHGEGKKIRDARKEIHAAEQSESASSESAKLELLGVDSLLARRYAEALWEFQKAVDESPLRTKCHLGLAESAVKLYEEESKPELLERARRSLEIASRLDPQEKEVAPLLALVLLYQGDKDGALAQANLARDYFPDRWQALSVAGLVQAARGKHALAVHLFSEGIKRAPDQASLYINRALSLEKLERYEEAAADLKSAEANDPSAAEKRRIDGIRRRLVEAATGK